MISELLKILEESKPQSHIPGFEVSKKGKASTFELKNLILSRIKNHPVCKDLSGRGERFTAMLGEKLIRFGFAVTAIEKKEWWFNARLKAMKEKDKVYLGVWNPGINENFCKNIIVFQYDYKTLISVINKCPDFNGLIPDSFWFKGT